MKSYLTVTNVRSPIVQSLVGIAACALVISGCAGGTKLAHNAKGSVYLEEVTDWSFEASHPAVIDQLTITKIVKGLYSNDGMSGSSRMSAGGGKPMRIFSDEDAEFLSPLLAQGLSKAKPEQLVGFRVSSSAGSGSEPTTGSIYVQKGSIYLTIGKSAKPTGFLPESAARTEPAPAYAAGGELDAMTMIIDYHALARAPMPAALPSAKAMPITPIAPMMAAAPAVYDSAGQEAGEDDFLAQKLIDLKLAKEALAKKDSEINMLRKESEWIKRELRNRDEEIKALRLTKVKVSVKPAPKKKSAQATHIR
ncbi:MAG TPA: hypothetical protein VGQ08_04805 [Nitrospiraceae bacterium]|jgi:hypothetical protein|nr:hypothetical protein [Nitrospiraceae bacterium]